MSNFGITDFINWIFNFTLVTINQTPITLASLVIFIVIFISFVLLSKLLTRIIISKVLSHVHIDEGTKYNLERLIYYTFAIIGAIVAFQLIGINLSGLAVIFGLFSVGIGFGLQNVTSNFVAGLILLLEKPIKVGDRVMVEDTEGDVIAINIRSTTILSINNIAIIVPNSDFVSKKVTNWSYGDKKVRLDIEVGVSYNSNLDTVINCLTEVASENNHVLKIPEPVVLFTNFSDSSWNMQLQCWISNPKDHRLIRSMINCAIVRKFRENKVEIPYPQRDLHIRSTVPLKVTEHE